MSSTIDSENAIIPISSHELATRTAGLVSRGRLLLQEMDLLPPAGQPDAFTIGTETARQVIQLALLGKGTINDICCSPRGAVLAIASSIGVYLYEEDSFEELYFVPTQSGIDSIAFSRDGEFLAAGASDGTLHIWRVLAPNVETAAVQLEHLDSVIGHTGAVTGVSFSPVDTILASASTDGTLRLWRIFRDAGQEGMDTLELYVVMENASPVSSLAFSPDGTLVASGSGGGTWANRGTIQVWSAEERPAEEFDQFHVATLEGHNGPIQSIDFSPGGKTLASGSSDGTIRLWQCPAADSFPTSEGILLDVLKASQSSVTCVSFSPDGEFLASACDDGSVQYWNPNDGALFQTFTAHASQIRYASFSPDGTRLLTASAGGSVRTWDVHQRTTQTNPVKTTPIGQLEDFSPPIDCVAFSPDNVTLASGTQVGSLNLWHIEERPFATDESGTLIKTLRGHHETIAALAFSPDGTIVASGSHDNTVRLWDTSGCIDDPYQCGNLRHVLGMHTSAIENVAFSSDGEVLAAASQDCTVWFWQTSEGTRLAILLADQTKFVWDIAISPDWNLLAVACYDNSVQIWNAKDENLLHTLEGHTATVESVNFSPDGTVLATGSYDETVRLWQPEDGVLLHTLEGHRGRIACMAFSPNGDVLVSGSSDGTLRLWQVSNGARLRTLEGHTAAVTGVAFSPNGDVITSVSVDGTLRLWGIPPA